MRTGRSSVVNDFIRDPGTRPWHALASRAGFASLAALPFLERGKVVAVHSLCARDIDVFADALTVTLDEIGPFVSFALDALAAKSDRRRDEGELRLRDRVIRAVSAGICISDPRQPDNPVIFVNPGFEGMTGYSSLNGWVRNAACRVAPRRSCSSMMTMPRVHLVSVRRSSTTTPCRRRRMATVGLALLANTRTVCICWCRMS